MKLIKKFYPFLLKIYDASPIFLQNLAISLYGLLLYLQRYGKTYKKYLKIYSQRDYSSIQREKSRQNKLFLQLLHYAVKNSPFYQEFYKDVDISQIKSTDDIGRLPILTKDILKENLNKVYTLPQSKALLFYTGGTTGTPMAVLKRKPDVQRRMAYLDAYKSQYGFITNKMRSARFFGKNISTDKYKKHIFWRDNYISKQRFYSTYHLQEENLKYYVKNLNSFKPEAIDGFVSAIYSIAKYIHENQIPLNFKPKAVFTTAETVLPLHRELIEKVFGCPLSDQYASNEGAPFIKQCRYGSYHECLDTGIFEHIKTGSGIKLIVTSFDSFGTPLIRYDIGDGIIETELSGCACGCVHPVVAGIQGRNTDYLLTKSKGRVSLVQLSVLVSELPSCYKNIQFIQKDKSTIKIVVTAEESPDLKESDTLLLEKAKHCLGSDMEFLLERWEDIPRSASGKFQMIINQIKEEAG